MDQHTEEFARAATSARRRWQFGLPDLFALMTWSAVAAAIAAAFGWGTLLTTAGLLLAGLNCRGAFAIFQGGRNRVAIVWVAWGLFLVSLFLPCTPGIFGTNYIFGYEAAWFALVGPIDAVRDPARLFQPAMPWLLLMNAANILILSLPAVLWRMRLGHVETLSAALCFSMVAVWTVASEPKMLVGYYVWCAGFYLALIALPVKRRSLAAMAALALVLGIMLGWDHIRL